MIVKTKRGYYVYSAQLVNGRRKRLGGPYTTYKQASRVNVGTKTRKRQTKRKK